MPKSKNFSEFLHHLVPEKVVEENLLKEEMMDCLFQDIYFV